MFGGIAVLLVGATMVHQPNKGLSSCILSGGLPTACEATLKLFSKGGLHNTALGPKVGNLKHPAGLLPNGGALKQIFLVDDCPERQTCLFLAKYVFSIFLLKI